MKIILIFLILLHLASCYWIDIISSKQMQDEFKNGAIVRQEMRSHGEIPWSNFP